ncbi:MAG: winged helix DNA-binding protein [Gammaproteobacteria bacterium]|jgi:predicted MarR family transcription regulator|nr:winged helix DNA-binding protein [Gammaproteobacteria bacterium]
MTNKKQESEQEQLDEAHYRAWHLARSPHEAISTEYEWSVLRFQQAFERWITQLADITGLAELSYIEIIIMHVIRMQDRPKTAASIARQLNRDDIPNIQYCLRKLVKMDLCQKITESGNKTTAFEVTEKGKQMTDRYAEVRRQILTEQTKNIDRVDEKLREATQMISLLTGLYDEAGRITASYSPFNSDK